MGRMTMVIAFGLAAWALSACASKATPEEIRKMCGHYARMTGEDEVPAKADLVADVERLFGQTAKDVKAVHDNELRQFEEDVNARIAASTDDAEKATLQQNLEAKKKQLEDKLALDTASNESRKAEELGKVDSRIKEAEVRRDAALKKCVDKATADGIAKSLAECRIKAETLDKYNNVCY